MTKRYPAGSEWRKWDLHVHVPGTKLVGYGENGTENDFEQFAEIIDNSDVAVLGITDYFSVNQTCKFIKYFNEHYPNSDKLLLVNVEFRLNENVNKDDNMVNFHVIFNNKVTREQMDEFLSNLPTQLSDNHRKQKSCNQLREHDFETATVSRQDIKAAFKRTFGEEAEPTDYLIYLAPANGDGIRADSNVQRKCWLADEIDKDVHGVFGKDSSNPEYFLQTNRYEDESQLAKPKPVFGGCDAHNFNDLNNWLGKAIHDPKNRQVITWVKADPTFEGLQQTLVEPADRVSIEELQPDAKAPYKVISKVMFTGSSDFPSSVVFNPNLNAIIGSRSSGKSALLAHIAHAINPIYTVTQQVTADAVEPRKTGPAAGFTWEEVKSTLCRVEWADGSTGDGQVIYIPQNWLYQISTNPKEVTDKIRPVIASNYPDYSREQQRLLDSIKTKNDAIRQAIENWFSLADALTAADDALKNIGDKSAITEARDKIHRELESLRSANSLSAEDLASYQTLMRDLGNKRDRVNKINIETTQLANYVQEVEPQQFSIIKDSMSAKIVLTPNPQDLSTPLATILNKLIDASLQDLLPRAESTIVHHQEELFAEEQRLQQQIAKLETDNEALVNKYKTNASLGELVKREKDQQDSLESLTKLSTQRNKLLRQQTESVKTIETELQLKTSTYASIKDSFQQNKRQLDQLTFGIEIELDPSVLQALSEPFKKNEVGSFLKNDGEHGLIVDIAKAQTSVADFLNALYTKTQKLNRGYEPLDVACKVLCSDSEIRFTAVLDQDRIGGFTRSTMTPGKQALFALTLILGESDEEWPLLIDQPEDDLDSRSIYNDIVGFLVKQKKLRQIILVTHNANLVVGADAEEVLVANRHGDDRRNNNRQTFAYLTGSLENSKPESKSRYELDRQGIREFAVEILDGGEEAFEKRRAKYKL